MNFTELLIGFPAPAIRLGRTLKGDPVTALELDKTYVIEFWATWCKPCLASIAHLTALQAEHPDVTILGVAAHEYDANAVTKFVAERTHEIGYRVALDLDYAGSANGWMHRHWFTAAYRKSIPFAFIVDKTGTIAWMGHPEAIDGPLVAVLSGRWNLQAAAKTQLATLEAANFRQKFAASECASQMQQSGDWRGALHVYDDAFARDPDLEASLGHEKLGLLVGNDKEAARAYASRLIDVVAPALLSTLTRTGMTLLKTEDGNAGDPELIRLSVDAYKKAEALANDSDGTAIHLHVQHKLATGLLALGQTDEALAHIELARELISKLDPSSTDRDHYLHELALLADQCKAAEGPKSKATSSVICNDDHCWIAP